MNQPSSSGTVLSKSAAETDLELLVETDSTLSKELKKYLSVYKLRSKVKIEDVPYLVYYNSDISCKTYLTDHLNKQNNANIDTSSILVASVDPRLNGYGSRIVSDRLGELTLNI
jgi:hypothetical protein